MTEISFLETDEPIKKPQPATEEQVDGFVAFLEQAGFVKEASHEFLEAQKVRAEAQISEKLIGPWEFQYGFHNNDYVFSFWPSRSNPMMSEKIEKKSNSIILAIVKILQNVIPDTMPVNIFKPSQYVDVKVFTVKIMDAKIALNFEASQIENLFLNIAQEAIKASK